MRNYYENTAWLYDLRQRILERKDIPFYVEAARNACGPVLELGSGTGVVTIPIAQAGIEIWGLERSEPMITEFEKNRAALPEPVRERLHLVKGDMASFELERKFALIIIPNSTFILLTEQQQSCLGCIHDHLDAGGTFIMEVVHGEHMDASWLDVKERLIGETRDPRTGRRVRQFAERREMDVDKRIFGTNLVFYVEQADGSEKRFADELLQRWYTEIEMRELLTSSGFEIIREMGHFDGRPIDQGRYMIFLCRKRQARKTRKEKP